MTRALPRIVAGFTAVSVLVASLTACANSADTRQVGADLSKAGPSVLPGGTAAPPTDVAETSAPADPAASSSPASETATAKLHGVLIDVLKPDHLAPATGLRLEQRPAARNQLVIGWTTSTDDANRRTRIRAQVLAVLTAVKRSKLTYGSVLLMIHGEVESKSSSATTVQLVRAKYSRQRIAGTDFSRVRADRVFDLVDDKAAELHPRIR